ncbi:NAD-dependent epimerase/dehydratase family protein [Trujillonella humicola]|uniref:NAD-dependent epimerase/dehydratase family protein n=1 Tax=Trujillonella humicola TaxID=3383699 RepID=UPI003906B754
MRTLVLGGTSFVGGRLVDHLLRDGADVTLLNRGRSAPPPGVGQLVADRTDADSMRAALASGDWDAVVDVSGFVKAAGGSSFEDLVALLDGRVGRYVFVSSVMAYAPTGVFPWTEDRPVRDEPPTTYGGFKVYAERVLLAAARDRGFPATVGRPAAIYGPTNNIYDMETAMFTRLRRGLPVLEPHQGLVATSYGHVDELCAGLLALARHPAAVGEVVNLSGDGVTAAQYVATAAEVVGVEPDVVHVPDEALPGLTPLPFSHLFLARHHGIVSTEKARHLLGLPAERDFATGMAQTYEWFLGSPLADAGPAMSDPLWGAGFDLDLEARVAAELRA